MMTKRKRRNYANRFVIVMLGALAINILMYWLPDSLGHFNIKKVDMFSSIRLHDEESHDALIAALLNDSSDTTMPLTVEINDKETIETEKLSAANLSHKTAVEKTDKKPVQQTEKTVTNNHPVAQTLTQQDKDTVKNETVNNPNIDNLSTDFLSNTNIEDFTTERTGLKHFFAALNNIPNLNRPVRIAFLGDSFIEGDIFVADFRQKMQAQFGGRGVGFIPIESNVSQYRPTIKQSAEGWRTYSIIKDQNFKYVLSGLLFEPDANNATIEFQTVDLYSNLQEVSSLKFLYAANSKADLILKRGSLEDIYELPQSEDIAQLELKGSFTKGTIKFKGTKGLKALGIALEDNSGIVVDNFSLRGNSGIVMSQLDAESCHELQQVRPYDLIILQYGLNVASDSVKEYSWYCKRMLTVIEHIQFCFPGVDIMILGVSDRSHKRGDVYSTMPAVTALLKAQRQIAIEAEVTFWSIFAAMGGENSMVKYVKSNWASKDYTHLSFRGGREIANALFDALLSEKGMYDNKERLAKRF